MNKVELIKAVAAASGEKQVVVRNILEALDSTLKNNAAAGEETHIWLITVAVVGRPARMAKNPRTGAAVSVPASNAIKLKASSTLKAAANRAAK